MTNLKNPITITFTGLEEAVNLWHILNAPFSISLERYAKRNKVSIDAIGETQCGLWFELNNDLEVQGVKKPFDAYNPLCCVKKTAQINRTEQLDKVLLKIFKVKPSTTLKNNGSGNSES